MVTQYLEAATDSRSMTVTLTTDELGYLSHYAGPRGDLYYKSKTGINKVRHLAQHNTPPPTHTHTHTACLVILKVKVKELLSVFAHFVVLGLVISMSAHLVWLLRDQGCRRYTIHKDSMKFWIITVTLTLKTTIYFLHKTLQLMMTYHPNEFGCRKICSPVDIVGTIIFDYVTSSCHLEDSKPIFLHDTGPWRCITI